MPVACGFVGQCGADHLGGVGPARLQRGWQQHLGGFASAAASSPGPHVNHRRAEATDAPAGAVSPPLQGVSASATGTDQLALGQGLLGRLGGTDKDHRVFRSAWATRVVYHALAGKGPSGVDVSRFTTCCAPAVPI